MKFVMNAIGVALLALVAIVGVVTPWMWGALGLGLIPAAVARSKGSRAFFAWWAFGALLFVIALPAALLRRNDVIEEVRSLAHSIDQNMRRRPAYEQSIDEEDEGPNHYGDYSSWVAGIGYRPSAVRSMLRDVRSGEMLALKRDPLDTPDPNAVALYWHGRHIGYVPARHAPWVAERLDASRPVSIFVDDVEIDDAGEIDRIGTVIRTRPIG